MITYQVLEEIIEMLASEGKGTMFTNDQAMLISSERNVKVEWSWLCMVNHGHIIKFNRDNWKTCVFGSKTQIAHCKDVTWLSSNVCDKGWEMSFDNKSNMSHWYDVATRKAAAILLCNRWSLIWSCCLLTDIWVSSNDSNRNRSCLNTILNSLFSFLPQTQQSYWETSVCDSVSDSYLLMNHICSCMERPCRLRSSDQLFTCRRCAVRISETLWYVTVW